MKTLLRIRLPRLSRLDADAEVDAAQGDGRGGFQAAGRFPLSALAVRWPRARVQAILHPHDAVLASVALPPLPAAKLRAALAGAMDGLLLGDPDEVILTHGPRAPDGQVPVAWTAREPLQRAEACLRGCQLTVSGFLPAPCALPVPDAGWTVHLNEEGYAVVRTGMDTGFVYPRARVLPGAAEWEADELSPLLVQGTPSHIAWVGSVPPFRPIALDVPSSAIDAAQAWLGASPAWSLTCAAQSRGVNPGAWRGPITAGIAAALVWVVGLNVQAHRLESAGQAMTQDMHARVKATFPTLGVIMNPLQQARQQRDARMQAANAAAQEGFAGLLGLTLLHSPFADGQVKTLRYADGQLTFDLDTPGAVQDGPTSPAWVEKARQAGLSVEPAESGWHVRASAPSPEGAASQPVRQAKPSQPGRTRS